MTPRDPWATWLLETRSGRNDTLLNLHMAQLARVRDRVLKYADIRPGDRLLDVGCGDGLIAFGALELVGESGSVVFSDVSRDLLEHCRAITQREGFANCSEFIEASATDLSAVPTDSVDIVTTRSVLIYVQDKSAAFHEFFRVLQPGGRISLFEPINSIDLSMTDPNTFNGMDVTPVTDLATRLKQVCRAITPVDGPMLGFDERDLVKYSQEAGFDRVKLRYEYESAVRAETPAIRPPFEAYLNAPPNPLAPSLNDAMAATMTPGERELFVAYLRPQFESGRVTTRSAVAYLQARKG